MTNMDRIMTGARGIVMDQLDRRTADAGKLLQNYTSNLHSAGDTMRGQGIDATAKLADYAADRLGVVAAYLTQTSGGRIVHDAENVARRSLTATGAVGFIVGFTVARMLRTSSASQRSDDRAA